MKVEQKPRIIFEKTVAGRSSIVKAEYLHGYRIKFLFSDGHVNIVDFEPFLKDSQHPMIRTYLSVEKFKKFKISDTDIFWNDYEMSFFVDDLYSSTDLK